MPESNKKITDENRRHGSRQPVLLKAVLDAGSYKFDCIAYDLSLNGIRLKLDLPLEVTCAVEVMVKQCQYIPAHVVWVGGGFIGLEFSVSSAQVAEMLGDLGAHLPKT